MALKYFQVSLGGLKGHEILIAFRGELQFGKAKLETVMRVVVLVLIGIIFTFK